MGDGRRVRRCGSDERGALLPAPDVLVALPRWYLEDDSPQMLPTFGNVVQAST
jgi:hypothetical protein